MSLSHGVGAVIGASQLPLPVATYPVTPQQVVAAVRTRLTAYVHCLAAAGVDEAVNLSTDRRL
jgi:hypothetical protein